MKSLAEQSGEGLRQSHQPFTWLSDESDMSNIDEAGEDRKKKLSRKSAPKNPQSSLGFDLVNKTVTRVVGKVRFFNGILVHVKKTEQSLPADIMKQAKTEGALGGIVAVHQ
jgi:hypothetical protein